MASGARIAVGWLLARLRDLWLMLGAAIVLLVLAECVLDLAFALTRPHGAAVQTHVQADAYGDATWPDAYYREHRRLKAQWWPFVYWRTNPFRGRFITVGEDGLRVTPAPPERPRGPGEAPLRVFLFGGSTMWGMGARDEGTIAAAVWQELAAAGVDAEVVNMGMLGYVSRQEGIALMLELAHDNVPDVAVFYDGINDVDAVVQGEAPGTPLNEAHRRDEFNLVHVDRGPEVDRLFMLRHWGRSSLLRFARAIIRRVAPGVLGPTRPGAPVVADADSLADAVVDEYLANVRWIANLGREYGFDTLFYWQPAVFTKAQRTDFEQLQHEVAGAHRDFFLKTRAHLLARARAADAAPVEDLGNVFGQSSAPVFVDWMHLGETGNAVVGARIAGDIEALMETAR
ncbi:MAG: hypothetical protein OEO21_04515 [Candidatus Krumholzibacteria bacterium]|nr:hypothetical protein [Candidatus Krumholzibacteria bacterium]